MPEKIQLGPVLMKRIEEFRDWLTESVGYIEEIGNELPESVDYQRELWWERSERWQEGDRGTVASDWIDGIEELADQIKQLASDATEIASRLADVENEPNFDGI